MQATHVLPSSLVQVHRIPVLALQLNVLRLCLLLLDSEPFNVVLSSFNLLFGRDAHLRRLLHEVFVRDHGLLLRAKLLEDPLDVDLSDFKRPTHSISVLDFDLFLA